MTAWERRGSALNTRRMLLLVAALIAAGLIVRVTVARPATDFPGSHFNRGRNAAWLSVDWVNLPQAVGDIRAMADEAARRQIAYLYVYTSYLRANGEFNPTFAYAAPFVRTVKQADPDMKVLAWIGVPLQALAGNGIDLGDPAVRGKIVAFCARMVNEAGYDGIHLDPEPVEDGDTRILALLDEVRGAIGNHAMLSISTRHIWPLAPEAAWPLVGKVMWLADYYRQVAARVDQIALMTYDSTMPAPALYRAWTRFQVIALSRALDGTHTEVLIGVPTSEEQTTTHQPQAENMASGLQGVIDGLNDADAQPQAITSVAIYPHWETSADEWASYESLWLGR
jgi:spore germination protein YaaH